jgi:Fe2+ transport system protein FeoA
MTSKRLSELEDGQKAHIVKINLAGDIRRRLSDMGLVNGGEVELERIAPLGDPIEIKVKGYNLSLRKEIASEIEVVPEDMRLTSVPPRINVTVNRIRGGRHTACRLVDMGFTIGAQITVIENAAEGPLLVSLGGHHVALGRGMAEKVMVKEIPDV